MTEREKREERREKRIGEGKAARAAQIRRLWNERAGAPRGDGGGGRHGDLDTRVVHRARLLDLPAVRFQLGSGGR